MVGAGFALLGALLAAVLISARAGRSDPRAPAPADQAVPVAS